MGLPVQILICVICAVCAMVQAQNACRTPNAEAGICVPIGKCSLHVIWRNTSSKNLPKTYVKYIMKSYCKFENNVHYVCCAGRYILPTSIDSGSEDSIVTAGRISADSIEGHPSLPLINLPKCGRILEDKVSNGNNTELGEFPWVVQLLYKSSKTKKKMESWCGGSLISKRYVLTAAHCVYTSRPVAIRLGEHDTRKDPDCYRHGHDCLPPVQVIQVERIISHPEFNNPQFANDIAVIRMKKDANINNESVLPICLPTTRALQNDNNDHATIAGWGKTETKKPASILQKADLSVFDNKECQRLYDRHIQIHASQMCARGKRAADHCYGDSGGPLFSLGRLRTARRFRSGNVQTVRYFQYGIMSFGTLKCPGTETEPGIYTRVTHYMKWILDQMRP